MGISEEKSVLGKAWKIRRARVKRRPICFGAIVLARNKKRAYIDNGSSGGNTVSVHAAPTICATHCLNHCRDFRGESGYWKLRGEDGVIRVVPIERKTKHRES